MLQDLYPHIYHNEMAWEAPRRTIMPLFSRPTARSIAISQTGR